jgi:hypothetical protein
MKNSGKELKKTKDSNSKIVKAEEKITKINTKKAPANTPNKVTVKQATKSKIATPVKVAPVKKTVSKK